jgi:hypothetical protein
MAGLVFGQYRSPDGRVTPVEIAVDDTGHILVSQSGAKDFSTPVVSIGPGTDLTASALMALPVITPPRRLSAGCDVIGGGAY